MLGAVLLHILSSVRADACSCGEIGVPTMNGQMRGGVPCGSAPSMPLNFSLQSNGGFGGGSGGCAAAPMMFMPLSGMGGGGYQPLSPQGGCGGQGGGQGGGSGYSCYMMPDQPQGGSSSSLCGGGDSPMGGMMSLSGPCSGPTQPQPCEQSYPNPMQQLSSACEQQAMMQLMSNACEQQRSTPLQPPMSCMPGGGSGQPMMMMPDSGSCGGGGMGGGSPCGGGGMGGGQSPCGGQSSPPPCGGMGGGQSSCGGSNMFSECAKPIPSPPIVRIGSVEMAAADNFTYSQSSCESSSSCKK